MKKTKLFILILFMAFSAHSQSVVLEFNAHHSCAQVNLDSIWIQNLTQGGKMVLYYPNNIAVFVVTDIGEFDPQHNHLYVSQNYPNPFSALTYIHVYLATPDVVSLNVYDLTGRTVASREDKLEEGMHRFSFSAGVEKTYILTVTSGKHVEKQIMLQMGVAGSAGSEISYLGASAEEEPKTAPKSSYFNFNPGDNLRFTGFVTDFAGNMDFAVIHDSPEESSEYLFDIANNPPSQPSEISGEDYVPVNVTGLVYEVHEQQGITYLWSVPDGWEITQGQGTNSITVDAGDQGGNISVTAENNCGMSEASVLTVEVFVPIHELALSSNPPAGGGVNGAGSYHAGEQINISATASQGWEFMGWTGDTDYVDNPSSANTTVTMPLHDISLKAFFFSGTVTDIDGNVYQTVNIGEQEWMAENLRVTRYNNGDDIPTGLSNTEWSNTTDGAYAIYDHNAFNTEGINSPEAMVAAYGKLYNWYAVDDSRGLCPEGWIVPNDDDWNQLFDYATDKGFSNSNIIIGVGNALKSCRRNYSNLDVGCSTTEHPLWTLKNNLNHSNPGFDEFGFSALPGGYRRRDGIYGSIGEYARFWSTSGIDFSMRGSGGYFLPGTLSLNNSSSVRCLREITIEPVYYTLQLRVNPESTGSVSGTGLYTAGEHVNITATSVDSWEFLFWSGNTDYVDDPTSANTTITMPSHDISLTANYKAKNDSQPGTVVDIDGNVYQTVIIGNQEWMTENLRVTRNSNGSFITRNCYDHDTLNCELYGGLYTWYTMMNGHNNSSNSNPSVIQGICPIGWNVPSDAEWQELIGYLVTQGFPNDNVPSGAGNALKSCRQIDSPLGDDCNTTEHPRWEADSVHYGIDEFGFSAFPGGGGISLDLEVLTI